MKVSYGVQLDNDSSFIVSQPRIESHVALMPNYFEVLLNLRLIIWSFPFLISIIAPAVAGEATAIDHPMNFALVRSGNCDEYCVQWISGEGKIIPDTPHQLKSFLKSHKGQLLPVVFQSFGGDVDGALAVGRMIRKAGLQTAVGRTVLKGCPMLEPRCENKIVRNGWSEGEVYAGSAYCFSACPFMLAGGAVRAAGVYAAIGLHQITNGQKSSGYGSAARRNLNAISTRTDLALRLRLRTYFNEMGVKADLVFAMMGLATPAGVYQVRNAEALQSGLVTAVFSDSDERSELISVIENQTVSPLN